MGPESRRRFPRALQLLGLATLAYNVTLFVVAYPLGILDGRLSYPPKEVGALFWRLGEAGRARYDLVARLDLFFIGLYTCFFLSLVQEWRGRGWAFLLPCLFAVLTAFFDLGETLGVRYLLQIFPEADKAAELMVSQCTPMKWLSLALFGLSIFGLWWRARAVAKVERPPSS